MTGEKTPAAAASGAEETWELILFVAGDNALTRQVYKRLERICRKHLKSRYRIERVDIIRRPEEAYTFDIIATPTLLRQNPKPVRRIIGDLSFGDKVIAGLGLPSRGIQG